MIGVEDNIPQLLKRCFHSNVEGLKLFRGTMDSPVGRLENMFPVMSKLYTNKKNDYVNRF